MVGFDKMIVDVYDFIVNREYLNVVFSSSVIFWSLFEGPESWFAVLLVSYLWCLSPFPGVIRYGMKM
ncbi:hypothetical protein AYI70_g9016 [Smittium culicis]|uniref:Uncharacterized protein n=1 Tax=Smittium culicis TaxID=133412 RepID=A0A1R1XD90_9FUNG|nr:hypothetical protein AYI70_g9016 [Smittium culicis]